MPLTLAIADNQNGSVDLEITGANGDQIDIYAGTAGGNWAVVATTSVDGTVTETLASGYYFFYAINTANGEMTAVSQRTKVLDLTSAAAALHQQCLEATVARLQDLLLADIDAANIFWAKVPENKALEADNRTNQPPVASRLPGILVCPTGQEKFNGGTNSRDDVAYPVAVYILARDNKDLTANLGKYLRWREQAIHALINQRLADVPEIFKAEIEPASIIHLSSWINNLLATAFTVRFTARRSRGAI
jgi:hypothetical protein